ncbi:unnamed protein product, partial [Iphiclides podalirius]
MQMSGEWHKWHAYNFILCGLTDELIKLGAKPSVKMKVLWIWVRYIQKFQVKEDLQVKSKNGNDSLGFSKVSFQADSGNSEPEEDSEVKQKKNKAAEKFTKEIKIVTKGLLLAILYVALNLDRSNIQLYHLFRFIKEGRLSFLNCNKYIPKEIDTKTIPHWKSFSLCQSDYTSHTIRAYAMACIKTLNLGLPFVPDMNKIINNYIKELCLPKDFKNLVLSLMLCYPCDYLDIDKVTQKTLLRLPDYEGVAMAYVVVALKMCFGLDGEYEERLSDAVDKINNEENYVKSHKLGMFSDSSDRLFSFREWARFLQFRKTILSQHYLPMARQFNQEVDDYVLMEQWEERATRPIKLRDEVTMDILNKIPLKGDINVIPKSKFVACLTPMANYTDAILNYVHDNELRLLLSEDFSQYSLKYATESLTLLNDATRENLIVGVNESNKIVDRKIEEYFDSKKGDLTMVFVRNCENKNWLKTNPPKAQHITKISENETCESDHGYDSNIESSPVKQSDSEVIGEKDLKLKCVEDENDKVNIFDDSFVDLLPTEKYEELVEPPEQYDWLENVQEDGEIDLSSLNRDKIIDELVSLACKRHRVTMPLAYVAREPRKRRRDYVENEDGERVYKKKKPSARRNEVQKKIDNMIVAYYNHLNNCSMANVLKSLHEPEFETLEGIDSCLRPTVQIGPLFDTGDSTVDLNEISPTLPDDNLLDMPADNYEVNTRSAKADSNFDEKTHNIEQLYVKLKQDVAVGELSFEKISEDPDLDEIITKKIEQFKVYENAVCFETDKGNEIEYNSSDTDGESDDQETDHRERDRARQKESLEPLVRVPEGTKTFKYWLRHYSTRILGKNLDLHQKFDMELREKCPASFNLIINECAAILGCSVYCLYKGLQNLEAVIIAKAKQERKCDMK